MAVVTTQPHLPFALLLPESLRVSDAVELVDTPEGGKVFVNGSLQFVWDCGDTASMRFEAAKLVDINAATGTRPGRCVCFLEFIDGLAPHD
jgi:hypothetical protein